MALCPIIQRTECSGEGGGKGIGGGGRGVWTVDSDDSVRVSTAWGRIGVVRVTFHAKDDGDFTFCPVHDVSHYCIYKISVLLLRITVGIIRC